jgi:hypothetical protein
MRQLNLFSSSASVFLLATALLACTDGGSPGDDDDDDDDDVVVPDRDSYREWFKVEPPGAVCGDGSQYKFFVNYSDVSNDLVVVFEPGGACWDYASCTGQNGIRGAANVNGLEDDHYYLATFISPFFQRDVEENHTKDWNYVYVPYCTGDVHTGNNVITYEDETGENPPIEFHHAGHDDVQKVISWMAGEFTDVPKMLVTGCSAGGAGSITNYHFLRQGLPGVRRGFMLDDSGPIFPSTGFSGPLHEKIRSSWNVDSILTDLPAGFDQENFGTINTALAAQYPDDRLATTYFRRDLNFSLYSYERFYDFPPKEEVMDMWWSDTQELMAQYDEVDNLAYYIPYWRNVNDSHCTTLFSYAGSEIAEMDLGLDDFVANLLDDTQPMISAVESVQPGEDVEE